MSKLPQIEQFADLAYSNRELFDPQGEASCYQCLWVGPVCTLAWLKDDGLTASCPICGFDSCVPGRIQLWKLEAAQRLWFKLPEVIAELEVAQNVG